MAYIGKITILALAACVMASVLKPTAPESTVILSVTAVVVVLAALLTPLQSQMQYIIEILQRCGLPETLLKPLFKTIAIALCVRVGSGIFQDAGNSALGTVLEIAGSVCEIAVSLPILQAVVHLLEAYI